MKKTLLFSIAMLCVLFAFPQTTATNFNVADCNDVNHELFAELDDNKVIIIAWVMPCGACIAPTLESYTAVQDYSGSNPNQVLFYMVDDYANTTCSTLNNWANTYGMNNTDAFFSDADIKMSDYGTNGMPKIVVVGGPSHKVYFNKNSSATDIKLAIDEAIADCNVQPVNEISKTNFGLTLFPNPAQNNITVSYNTDEKSEITLEIINMLGETVETILNSNHNIGNNEIQFNTNKLPEGYYFMKIKSKNDMQVVKFIINR